MKYGWSLQLYTLAGNDLNLKDRWLEVSVKDFFDHLMMLEDIRLIQEIKQKAMESKYKN